MLLKKFSSRAERQKRGEPHPYQLIMHFRVYLYEIAPTAQVVHALTYCKPVSFASFFHLRVRKDKEK